MSQTVLSRPNKRSAPPSQPLPVPPVQVLLPITTPPRRRSNSAILSWAARVQPGSPSSPRRRPSIGHGPAPPGSSSFITLIDTPSTAGKQFDLTNLGYSSVFVGFPATSPKSACVANIPIPPVPASPPARRVLKHFRSLSALTRSRGKSVSSAAPPVPPVPAMPATTPKSSKFFAKRKAYAKHTAPRPAPLANELALMQFADGGSLESHAQRVLAHQAKAAGPGVGVGAVFRDANGGLWWDAEEEWEFAHLLGGEEQCGEGEWVEFSNGKENDEERRGSVSTQDSDLDARFLVQPADDDALAAAFPPHRRGATTVLALPARRRPAPHLRKPAPVDAAFGATPAPRSPTFSCSPKAKGSERRRPAPLKLARPHAHVRAASAVDGRTDFFAASFAPSPLPAPESQLVCPLSPVSPGPALSTKGKPSVLNVRGLFRRRAD
ncbi:hypothetical protein DFH07DRAFT_1026475 [Mycena maculata]|uniref:Uncharacterized protein n=1 Tax=Mycena maculata TaxID=230809 RepID=A0AAD7K831_9AGAR|nr:hypothetical protein DFH07DRAFT_1026475 [Mycena maculata]